MHFTRLPIFVIAALAAACGGAGPEPAAPAVEPTAAEEPARPAAEPVEVPELDSFAADLGELLARIPLAEDAPLGVTELVRTEHHSVSLVVAREPIGWHYHASHDETVVMLSGRGALVLESTDGARQTHELEPGAVVFMPRERKHSFTPLDDAPAACLSIMTPPFDGQDRIFVDE